MDKKQLEIRNLGHLEVRADENSRKIEGCAIVFDKPSVDMGFREVIESTAISQDLIDNSDIYLNFNHDDDKILGRWNKGHGSLNIELREDGVWFSIDAPKTDLGDEVLEYLRRGDVDKCSFCFWIDYDDEDAETWTYNEGVALRTIHKIAGLHDVSIVWEPAYDTTQVSARSLEKLNELRAKQEEDKEKKEDEPKKCESKSEDEPKKCESKSEDEPKKCESKKEDEPNDEPKDEPKDNDKDNDMDDPDDGKDNPDDGKDNPDNEEDNPDEKEVEPKPEDEPDKDKENTPDKKEQKSKINTHNIMSEKKFNLLSAIRSIAENKPLDPEVQAVVDAGKSEMRNAGLSVNGQLQIPAESRAAVTVTTEGEDVVVTDFANILEPLRTKNVLVESGAHILTGLVGDLQIPAMGAENVNWEGETDAAQDGASTFTNVKLTPHRLSAYIDISKQFLVQDSLGAEALIRRDLVNAIQSKLEATIFSTDAADGSKPAGIFNGKVATKVTDFKGLCTLESDVEDANFYGPAKYIVSPKAKAAMRAMAKSTKSTQLVLEGDNIDGVPVLSTGHIAKDTFAYGDWSQLYVGQWGAIDLTVDPYTKAADGQVRLVVNCFFDFKLVRPKAVVYGTTAGE